MDVIQKQDRGTITENTKTKRSILKKETDTKKLLVTDATTAAAIEKKREAKKLKKKLLQVAERNESLSKAINDKNAEIADLKRSVQSLNDVLNSVPIDELRCNSSIASTKILDLSKKNRQLRAEVEQTKNRISKKDIQIQKLQREIKAMEEKFQQDTDMMRKGNFTPIDEMQNKLNSLQQRLFESRNKNVELQNQLKLAQKCLQQEVGENFNLNILASQASQSHWRGRAQQILHLQQKVHELKERLESYEHFTAGRISSYPSISEPNAAPLQAEIPIESISSSTSFDRFAPNVRKSEIQHRAKVEALEKEIASLKTQLEDQRGKILALKVRNKTLNDDMIRYKMKSSTLEEQTDFDGLNLATINDKMNIQKFKYENRIEELNREVSIVKRQCEEAEYREEDMRGKLENLESLLEEKELYIEELNGIIKKLETDLKAVCGGFLFSCRELRKEEFVAILDALESEKNQLAEHNKTLNARITQERTKNENLSEQLSKQKIRIVRLDAKIRELERELDIQTERKRRTQRIAEYANSVSSNNGCLGSFVFEKSSTISIGSNSCLALNNDAEMSLAQVAELKHQLEFASEKIILLEEKITHLTEEKENDAKAFDEIIANSKNIILDTILNEKTNIINQGNNNNNDVGSIMS